MEHDKTQENLKAQINKQIAKESEGFCKKTAIEEMIEEQEKFSPNQKDRKSMLNQQIKQSIQEKKGQEVEEAQKDRHSYLLKEIHSKGEQSHYQTEDDYLKKEQEQLSPEQIKHKKQLQKEAIKQVKEKKNAQIEKEAKQHHQDIQVQVKQIGQVKEKKTEVFGELQQKAGHFVHHQSAVEEINQMKKELEALQIEHKKKLQKEMISQLKEKHGAETEKDAKKHHMQILAEVQQIGETKSQKNQVFNELQMKAGGFIHKTAIDDLIEEQKTFEGKQKILKQMLNKEALNKVHKKIEIQEEYQQRQRKSMLLKEIKENFGERSQLGYQRYSMFEKKSQF